jgi:hypothetical protein
MNGKPRVALISNIEQRIGNPRSLSSAHSPQKSQAKSLEGPQSESTASERPLQQYRDRHCTAFLQIRTTLAAISLERENRVISKPANTRVFCDYIRSGYDF